ncbi:MAG: extracellular solute-binding protein [Bacillota bacterium]|nr:extracellular solute-binding protein [Bacillota bacterium]
MKPVKKLSLLVALAMSLGLVAGCSSTGTNGGKAGVAGPIEITQPITISFWHTHSDQGLTALNNAIAAYKQKFPNVTIDPVFQGTYSELSQKLTAAQVASTLPAMTVLESALIPQYADSDFMQDLNGYAKADKVDLADFAEGMLKAYAYNNKQVALPYMVSTECILYNKDIVDSEKLTIPQKWGEMEAFLQKATKFDAAGKPTRQAMAIGAWDPWYYEPWFLNQGVNLINSNNTTDIASDKSVGIVKQFKQWMDKGYLQMPYGKGASTNMRQAFIDGKFVAVEYTTALIDMFVQSCKFNVGVSFLPGADKRNSMIGGCGIVIPSKISDDQKKAAWTYLNFVTSPEYNIKWATDVGYMPTRHSSVKSADGKAFLEKKPQYAAIFNEFDNVSMRIRHSSYTELSNYYKEAIGKVCIEGADPATVLKDAETSMNAVFKELS